MAWVRLDDSAMDHPKILQLTDAQFRLWVKGLCYCQKHLTDGLIPDQAIKAMFGKAHDVQRLCVIALWEATEGGFMVHDFLDWNDPRELVTERRKASDAKKVAHRRRMSDWRDAKKVKRDQVRDLSRDIVCDISRDTSRDRPQVDHGDALNQSTYVRTDRNLRTDQTDPTASARSAPPTTHGKQHGRIFVHPWQLMALIDTLGPHASNFGLDEWVFSLSALADARGLTFPEKKAVWPWVQQQLGDEIRRRKLPIAGSEPSADDSLQRMRDEIERQNAAVRRA